MNPKRVLAAATLILLLAFTLRVLRLGDKTVWWDEAWSVWTAQQSFAQTTEITARDVHPPLYQWLLNGWLRVTGISEFAVRYLSLLWGLLTVAALYALVRRLANLRAALLAALFLAISTFAIHWSQETRMYSMTACAVTLAVYAYLRIGTRWSRWWLLLIAASTTAALTHYLGALVLVVLNLHWLLLLVANRFGSDKDFYLDQASLRRLTPIKDEQETSEVHLRFAPFRFPVRAYPPQTPPQEARHSRAYHFRWLAAMLCCGALLALWALYAIPRIRSGGTTSTQSPAFIFQLAATLLANGSSINVDQAIVPALLIVAALLIGMALYTRRQRVNGLLILLLVLFPPLTIFLLSLPNPFYHPAPEERYLLIFAPLAYAGIGLALDQFFRWRRWFGAVLAASLLLLYGYAYAQYLDTRYYRDDYAMMLRTISLLAEPDEPVFFVSGDRYPLVYYHLDRTAAGDYSAVNASEIPHVESDVEPLLKQIIGNNQRFWLVEIERGLGDPNNLVVPWLDAHYQRVIHIPIDYNGITLYAFLNNSATPIPSPNTVLPPAITEARPADIVRIGLPGKIGANLLYKDHVIAFQPAADSWQLAQFPIYPAYPPGEYTIHIYSPLTNDHSYSFQVTHSQPTPVNPPTNLNVSFGPLTLLGYDTNTQQLHAGDKLGLTLYWQVDPLQVPPENYSVFAHLLGPFNSATNGPLWAGQDGYPAQTPTRALWAGQIIADQHELTLPKDTPPGDYQLELGLYILDTGQRLKQADGSDHVLVAGFTVGN